MIANIVCSPAKVWDHNTARYWEYSAQTEYSWKLHMCTKTGKCATQCLMNGCLNSMLKNSTTYNQLDSGWLVAFVNISPHNFSPVSNLLLYFELYFYLYFHLYLHLYSYLTPGSWRPLSIFLGTTSLQSATFCCILSCISIWIFICISICIFICICTCIRI